MGDIKLFRISGEEVRELLGSSVAIERKLQILFEQHLEALLGVRFLATEYSTGKSHRGRIDTLGIDENNSPVIIEYKRAADDNVTNQGLNYLTWLLDHEADFKWLVMEKMGREAANAIEWSTPRVLCIAGDFNRRDENAAQQIGGKVELIRYQLYGSDHLVLEMVYPPSTKPVHRQLFATARLRTDERPEGRFKDAQKRALEHLEQSPPDLKDRFEALKTLLHSFGDDVQMVPKDVYIGFRRIKNFACVAVHPASKSIQIWAKVDPTTVVLEEGFTRDVRNIGHHGTGNLEIMLRTATDIERAEPLLRRAYEAS